MTSTKKCRIFIFCLFAWLAISPTSQAFEVFGKGSVSKNMLDTNTYVLNISASGGLAFNLFGGGRVEARYTDYSSLQNSLPIQGTGTLTNIVTQTDLYSVGIDIDILGDKSSFQPFIYLGAGYVVTRRSFYFTPQASSIATPLADPIQAAITGNLGLGFRLVIAKRLAIEIEAFGYASNITQPNPLLNLSGSAGVRLFL